MPEALALEVTPAEEGRRLDAFLAERLGVSRAESRRLLTRGGVRLQDREVGARSKGLALHAGECVEVADPTPPEAQQVEPEPALPLRILASGPGWLIVDKPAGLPVRPLEPGERHNLMSAVAARYPEVQGVGEGGLRSGVVHRLDTDSSGALLVATREDAWQRLRGAFREKRVEKVYRAIALGRIEEDGRLELDLVTARHRPARVRAAKPGESGAKRSATNWRVLERLHGATLLEVRTEGGFLHQVRASLAHLGHPLVGDAGYGAAADPTGAGRHMLHASALRFEEIEAQCPDAEDFAGLLERLR